MSYDNKGNATHYSDQRINTIHQLERIWGSKAIVLFCEMNAFKYRSRIGKKDDPNQELKKISWYEECASIYRNREVIGVDADLNNLDDHNFTI